MPINVFRRNHKEINDTIESQDEYLVVGDYPNLPDDFTVPEIMSGPKI